MRTAIALLTLFGFLTAAPVAASAQTTAGSRLVGLQERLVRVETQLEGEQEAHDRQADAFDAASSRIEFVAFALVVVLTLVGIVTGFLGLRWVRGSAEKQIEKQVEKAAHASGDAIFEAEAVALRDEYEEKFADLYRRYGRLIEEE